ncbi:MAG TPA: aldose epimerase [Acetobacteraceae bacterium]|nr:aldose epimerase [Acetobacteraceae bacterium]
MLLLEGGGWTASLLPEAGAAVACLRFRGRDVLAPLPLGADPNTTFCGAFVMAPWANRLDGGRLPVAGIEYRLPLNRSDEGTAIHGLARDRPWRVREASPSRAELTQDFDGAEFGLPWRYAARLDLCLDDAGAALSLRLCNRAELPFPFGLGWHPFFLRPPGTRLSFRAATRFARDARCLPVAAQPTGGLDGDEASYEGLDTHFAGWDGAAEIGRPDLRLVLSASGAWARNLQVFAPSGGKVLCVEPVSHVPDAPNRPAFAKHGPMALLPPGGALSARLVMAAGDA